VLIDESRQEGGNLRYKRGVADVRVAELPVGDGEAREPLLVRQREEFVLLKNSLEDSKRTVDHRPM
jgi:hypothetical protein